jgi:serine protease
LTVTTPSVRVDKWGILDSLSQQAAVPLSNTTYSLVMTFKNYLQPTGQGLAISLVSSDTNFVKVLSGPYFPGALSTLQSVSNDSTPFRIVIKSAGTGQTIPLYVNFSDGSYNDEQTIVLTLNPVYATHIANNLQVTMIDNGRIGFTDMSENQGVGCMFRGVNELYEAGLIVGISATKVVDCVRNMDGAYNQDSDFTYTGPYTIVRNTPLAKEVGSGAYGDSTSPSVNRIGLRISMHSYAFDTPLDSNYVIMKYDIRNVSGADLSNAFVGLFFDWDMQPDIASNKSGFDTTRALGYAWDTLQAAPAYCGVRSLDGKANFRGLLASSADLSRASKWSWISGGVVPNDTVGDVHFAISYGPLTIANGASTSVEYAICAGNGLAGIQASADAALAKWNAIKDLVGVRDRGPQLPMSFALEQNYPNPFNPATSVQYSVSEYSTVNIRIYNILGEEVASLFNGTRQRGTYTIDWNASGLPTGVYFYRMDAVGLSGAGKVFSSVKKMMLVR